MLRLRESTHCSTGSVSKRAPISQKDPSPRQRPLLKRPRLQERAPITQQAPSPRERPLLNGPRCKRAFSRGLLKSRPACPPPAGPPAREHSLFHRLRLQETTHCSTNSVSKNASIFRRAPSPRQHPLLKRICPRESTHYSTGPVSKRATITQRAPLQDSIRRWFVKTPTHPTARSPARLPETRHESTHYSTGSVSNGAPIAQQAPSPREHPLLNGLRLQDSTHYVFNGLRLQENTHYSTGPAAREHS